MGLKNPGRSEVPGRSARRISSRAASGSAPGRTHTSSEIRSPIGVPATTATSVPSMRRSSRVARMDASAAASAVAAPGVRSTTAVTSGQDPDHERRAIARSTSGLSAAAAA